MNRVENRLAEFLVQLLQSRHEPNAGYQRFRRWLMIGLNVLTWSYLLALGAYMLLARYVGEQQVGIAFLLYLPQQLFLLPGLGLLPLAALFARRSCLAVLLLTAVFGTSFMGGVWHAEPAKTKEPGLTVVANNRGEDNHQSFTSFLRAQQPDLLVLQEDGHAAEFRAAWAGFDAQNVGSFTLVSRYPILGSGTLELAGALGAPVAAWFEIEFQHQPLVIYNVHLPTPRQDLLSLRGRGLLNALFGYGLPRLAARRLQAQAPWDARVELARQLDDALAREKKPFIVAGDFNMPAWGFLHQLFAAHYSDSFREAGRGWGFSFPGDTRNPLTAFGPWLRIDYIFSGPSFHAVSAITEPSRKSQHRCVAAILRPNLQPGNIPLPIVSAL